MSVRHVALQFADALDRDDFDAARPLLHAECAYTIRDRTFTGPDAVLASYRAATDDAHATFDRVVYASTVSQQTARSALIEFSDVLTHQGQSHLHLPSAHHDRRRRPHRCHPPHRSSGRARGAARIPPMRGP